jgi:site-specific DNA-methyltransferase (adenine-specific)
MANGVHKITEEFENKLSEYTGSPFVVCVDNQSNALFLALTYYKLKNNIEELTVDIPQRTYPSVPCEIIHAGLKVNFTPSIGTTLKGAYRLNPTTVWDSALMFTADMYIPKSHNISKAIDKMHGSEREVIGKGKAGKAFNKVKGFGVNTSKSDDFTSEWDISKASTEEAKKWEGWGSALKPANEPIVLARKPLEKGLSIAENVLKWGTGAINIDASRIASNENLGRNNHARTFGTSYVVQKEDLYIDNSNGLGRFPSNVILTHHPDCKCEYFKYNGEEEINEDWNCHNDCPIKILDEQSGELKSGKMTANHNRTTNGSPNGIYGKFDVNHPLAETYGDKGGASRFFYVAKASQWERHYGLDNFEEKNSASSEFRPNHLEKSLNGESGNPYGRWKPLKNIHPTIKPIKLMQYLVRMITPPNGIILDPFSGSGTTGIACKIDDFEFVGLELDSEYVQIAKSRIEAFDVEKVFLDETKIYQNRVKNEQDDLSGFNQLNLFD